MITEKLPAIQRFLAFVSSNIVALLVLLLFLSIGGNVYLVKMILEANKSNEQKIDKIYDESIKYERERGKSFEDIIKETAKDKNKTTNNE